MFIYTYQNSKSYGQSVRCVKGDPSTAPVRPSSSSSVDETKSSSSVTSVSSSSVPEGYVDPSTVVTGTMTDSRDGQTYKTVKIGSQEWMAENLNYAYTAVPYKYKDNTSDSTSWCYDNDPTNCAKYGRLYTWSAAMDSVGTWSANGKNVLRFIRCEAYALRVGICRTTRNGTLCSWLWAARRLRAMFSGRRRGGIIMATARMHSASPRCLLVIGTTMKVNSFTLVPQYISGLL